MAQAIVLGLLLVCIHQLNYQMQRSIASVTHCQKKFIMKQDALKQPFFAALLESQHKDVEPQNQTWPPIKPTKPVVDYDQTHKYPSDGDEEGTQV